VIATLISLTTARPDFSDQEVAAIRASTASQAKLAKMYKVSQPMIWAIINRNGKWLNR
jgi:hypothetical protein